MLCSQWDSRDRSAEPGEQCMKLGPSAYLLLGMLRTGASSGYAIKKLADVSTRFFWPTSLAAVYPELARLERGGLVRRRDDPHSAGATPPDLPPPRQQLSQEHHAAPQDLQEAQVTIATKQIQGHS